MAVETAERFGVFDFGLTEEQEERAARLHADSIICDMLFQGPVGYRNFTEEMDNELREEFKNHGNDLQYVYSSMTKQTKYALRGDLPEYKTVWDESGLTAGNRQCPVNFTERSARNWGLTIAQYDTFPWLIKALKAEDIRRAKREGKHAGYMTNQNAGEMGPNIELLDSLYNMGLRMLQLSYNPMNIYAAGCTERTDAGVSYLGVKLIERMNQLGIIVDTGHCGRQTTLDACAISTFPVAASHTSAAAVYEVDRAKSDEELKALAATGGIIGVYAVPFFLAPGKDVTVEAMIDHIEYIANLVGWEHVGIGTDWPMMVSKEAVKKLDSGGAEIGFRPEHNLDSTVNLIGFDDYRDFSNITRGLVKRGFTDEQISGILGGNVVRVFEQVCG